MGGFRLQQDQDACHRFHNVLSAAFNGPIAEAMKSRRTVVSIRLTCMKNPKPLDDNLRARLKQASPERAEALRAEMEASEDEFVSAVDASMGLMKAVLSNAQLLKAISSLVVIQQQYHKVAVFVDF